MRLSFDSPFGALACLLALLPLLALLLRERHDRRVLALLGLGAPARRARLAPVAALTTALLVLGVAAAQPVLHLPGSQRERSDAQAFVVLDISGSMLARPHAGAPTRYERALAFALRLRNRLGDVPVGVGSLTDRPLVHLFPTADRAAFAGVLERALGIEQPPPAFRSENATDFGALTHVAADGFFARSSRKRLVVLLTDGETRAFDTPSVVYALRRNHVGLVLVRFGGLGDRIYGAHGHVDSRYVPDAAGIRAASALASVLGGRLYRDGELKAVDARARAVLGNGPTMPRGAADRRIPLGRLLVLLGALPLALLLARRYTGARLRVTKPLRGDVW